MTTKVAPKAHASLRPPSSASRWLSCPASVTVVPLYPNAPSEASEKGDVAHAHLENGLLFGLLPDTDDADMDINIRGVLEWVKETKNAYGSNCQVYAEQQYDIPETGEFGTSDITFVSPRTIHIADYKNGYVVVDVLLCAQLLCYLLGAIAKFGERPSYAITVLQPNYLHADGPYRTMEVTAAQVEWFREEVRRSMESGPNDFRAGRHCKKSYCPHRGACATFQEYVRNGDTLGVGWWTSEINALSDAQLVERLDFLDTVQGLRDETRKEAMRRILQMDRELPGYKIVKARKDREFAGEDALKAVADTCRELGATDEDLYSKKFESVAGIERFIKQKYKHFGKGKWADAFETLIQPHVRDFSGSLTLERATDGRPAHARGNEFGSLDIPLNTSTII